MSIKYLTSGLLIGMSTDTKPVLPADGLYFIEEDTGRIWKIISGVWSVSTTLGNVTNTSDANKPVSIAGQTALDLKATEDSPAFTGTPTGITKTHVGLGNVDNTSDASKPVSTATQTALDAKQATLVSATNIKTINGTTVLGSGDLVVTGSATAVAMTNLAPTGDTTITAGWAAFAAGLFTVPDGFVLDVLTDSVFQVT